MRLNKTLSAVIISLLGASVTQAATMNLRHEFVPRYDGQSASQKDRLSVSHRFANGVGFEVEAKWKSQNEDAIGEQTGSGQQANVSYVYKLNDQWSLKPQYKWESDSSSLNHQFNLTLGYNINSDWAVSFRHRYNYKNSTTGDNSHYNRWTFEAGYSGIQDWKFGASADYTLNPTSSGPVWEDKSSWFTEFNFTGEYKGLESGWRPFMELGLTPYESGQQYTYKGNTDEEKDQWRPRVRIGVKYNF